MSASEELPRSPTLASGEVIGGRYRLRARLGKGGMGEVWEAEHLVLHNLVAVKCMRNDTADRRMAQRLRIEADLISRLDHPNIVAVSDAGADDSGRPYVVMERLRGRTVAQLLAERGALAWTQARSVAVQIAAGLACAHAAGIIHRDLKPSNVFVLDDPHGNLPVKIIDFGLAKATMVDPSDQALTTSGTVFGTPTYMPPEQVRGETLDGRADLYALGAILYEMLTGRPPWIRESHVELLYCQLFEPPPSPRTHVPDVPADFDAIVQRCMCKDRTLRFANAEELRAVLTGAGTGRGATRAPVEVLPQPDPELRERYANVRSESRPPVAVGIGPAAAPAQRSNAAIIAAVAGVALLVAGGAVAWSTGLVHRLSGGNAEPGAAVTEPPGESEPAPTEPVTEPAAVAQPAAPVPAEPVAAEPAPAEPAPAEPPTAVTQPAAPAKPHAPTKTSKHGDPKHQPKSATPSVEPPPAQPPAAEPVKPPPAEPPPAAEPPPKQKPVKKGDLYEPFAKD